MIFFVVVRTRRQYPAAPPTLRLKPARGPFFRAKTRVEKNNLFKKNPENPPKNRKML